MSSTTSEARQPTLIPHPQSIIRKKGYFPLKGPFRIACPEEFKDAAMVLAQALEPYGLVDWDEDPSSSGEKSLIEFKQYAGTEDESYKLTVKEASILIEGGRQGLFYGIATLRQLLLQPLEKDGVPALSRMLVADKPRYSWRGVLLDCSRHFMSKKTVLRYLDYLALFKLNRFHWHLTDDQGWRLESSQFPKLTEVGAWRGPPNERYGGYYTGDDIREVVSYAAARGIVVIPEIDIPGHSTALIAAYPELGCGEGPVEVETGWGIKDRNLNPGKEETFEFLESLLNEVMDLFPSPWIHLGADECRKEPWKNSESCRKRIQDEGLADERELQTYFLNRILRILEKKDRGGIGWDEVLEGGLPRNIIVQSWQDHKFTTEAARMGARVIASPVTWCYLNHSAECLDLARIHSFEPCPENLEPQFQANILGGECALWSEFITESSLDHLAFPRILAMTEALWKPGGSASSFDHFRHRLRRFYPILDQLGIQYGPAFANSDPFYRAFGRIADFPGITDA